MQTIEQKRAYNRQYHKTRYRTDPEYRRACLDRSIAFHEMQYADPVKHEKLKKQRQRRRDRLRQWIRKLKEETGCSRCGEKHYACLDYHHKNPAQKLFCISRSLINAISKVRVIQEIAKCELLCANCHRKEHNQE